MGWSTAYGVGGRPVEDVVGRDVHQAGPGARHASGHVGGADRVDREGAALVGLRGVDRRLGGGVDDEVVPVDAGHALGDREVDIVRSGTLSPSLGAGIGTTYLPAAVATPGTRFEVECRGERLPAEVVKRPFWTKGSVRK